MAVATTEFYPYLETREEEEEEEEEERQEKTKDNEEQLVNLGEQKREERMKRLRELHLRKNEARKLNHQEVVEEDRRKKLPVNYESRRRRAEWEIQEEEAKKQAEEAGENYEQIKMLETSADELDRLERKRKKKNPDPGFSDYQQASYRQYQRLSKQIKPDMENYEKQKQEMGSDFYPSSDTLGYGGSGEVSQEGLERMVNDLEKQIDKHSKFSRRRAFKHNDDVDYINERNMRFNKKAARYYDKYTVETKQNLERGTAI